MNAQLLLSMQSINSAASDTNVEAEMPMATGSIKWQTLCDSQSDARTSGKAATHQAGILSFLLCCTFPQYTVQNVLRYLYEWQAREEG